MDKEFKQIEKQIKYYEDIKKIDSDIIKLEKLANLVNEGNKSNIKLSVDKPKPKDNPIIETEKQEYSMFSFTFSSCNTTKKEDDNKEFFESEINDILTFELIAVLLNKKKEIRDRLIKRITQ